MFSDPMKPCGYIPIEKPRETTRYERTICPALQPLQINGGLQLNGGRHTIKSIAAVQKGFRDVMLALKKLGKFVRSKETLTMDLATRNSAMSEHHMEVKQSYINITFVPTQLLQFILHPQLYEMFSQQKQKLSLGTFISEIGADQSVTCIFDFESANELRMFLPILAAFLSVPSPSSAVIMSLQLHYRTVMSKINVSCPFIYDVVFAVAGSLTSDLTFQNVTPAISSLMQSLITALCYIVDRFFTVYAMFVELPEATLPQGIPNSYNPVQYGAAYYFNEFGNRLRNIRYVTGLAGSAGSIHDEPPTEYCNKDFEQSVGSAYLMFFFCPAHGHCWGFHIIDGKEGRKDVHNVLYSYLDQAPEMFFYDFACGYSECGLNREAAFIRDTRLYHDIFHGVL